MRFDGFSRRLPAARFWATIVLTLFVPGALEASPVWIRLPTEHRAILSSLDCRPLELVDYGGFLWLQLNAGDAEQLRADGARLIEVPDAQVVSVPGYRFDPMHEEPRLPDQLTVKAHSPGLRLVQLVGPSKRIWLDQLRTAGLRLLQYYPSHTYLVWGSEVTAKRLLELPFIRWQGRFQPAYKIDSELTELATRKHPVDILIYDDGRLPATMIALEALGAHIYWHYPARADHSQSHIIAEVEVDLISVVARQPNVIWIGVAPSSVVFLDEAADAVVAGDLSHGSPQPGYLSWLEDLGYDGSGVIWSVNDSGVDPDHPDLRLVGGFTHGQCTQLPGDDYKGHGTAVAGLLAGSAAAGNTDRNGFLLGLGVAPGAALYAQTMCWADGVTFSGSFQELMRRVVQVGASGSNNSWVIPNQTGYQAIAQSLDTLVRDSDLTTATVAEPHIMVFGAGNDGPGSNSIASTAEAKNVISVGGTMLRGYDLELVEIDEVEHSSSRGPTRDGRTAPTLVAPAELVTSTQSDNPGTDQAPISSDDLYRIFGGTSAAAPHVSGALAVLTEWWRDTQADNADPSPAMARALLVNSATDIADANPAPNNLEGWGRVNLGRAVRPGVPRLLDDQSQLLSDTGERYSIEVAVPDRSQALKVTIAWTDPPAAIRAVPTLVNDLDLRVVTNGETYLGNQIQDGWSVSGGAPDNRNNLENVFLESHGSTATIVIEAVQLAADGVPYNGHAIDQDFALVCTNCAEVMKPRRPGRRLSISGNGS
jgi:hypothetical protein